MRPEAIIGYDPKKRGKGVYDNDLSCHDFTVCTGIVRYPLDHRQTRGRGFLSRNLLATYKEKEDCASRPRLNPSMTKTMNADIVGGGDLHITKVAQTNQVDGVDYKC